MINNTFVTAYIGYLVGLEQTSYRVPENVGLVELCVNVSFPVTDCPIMTQFNVSLSTRNGTAGNTCHSTCLYTSLSSLFAMSSVFGYLYSTVSPGDYESLNQIILTFSPCDTQHCVNVTIMDDTEDEPNEFFFYTLQETLGLHPNIELAPVNGEIVIIDNDLNGQYNLFKPIYLSRKHAPYILYAW